MGMYDYIRCEAQLPGDPPDFVKAEGHLFQTKDLECELATYLIRADGALQRPTDGSIILFHGDISFYSSNEYRSDFNSDGELVLSTPNGEDAIDVEYAARFTNGKLETIRVVEYERTPAVPFHRVRRLGSKRPTPEEAASWRSREAENLSGKTVFVCYGGTKIEDGYAATVIAEDEKNLVVRSDKAGLELLDRRMRDCVFFDSREDAEKDRAERVRQHTVEVI